MLGAQALRTKQKAEQKEKEKRHRERLRSVELERERLHKAAREEMEELAAEDERARGCTTRDGRERRDSSSREPPRHRHSLHSASLTALRISHRLTPSEGGGRQSQQGPQRSTSSDYCRQSTSSEYCRQREETEKKESGGNRFMRWLGLGPSQGGGHKRRMSTF